MANLLIFTPDRQLETLWHSLLTSEHAVSSIEGSSHEFNGMQAEMAIVDCDLLSGGQTLVENLAKKGLKVLLIGKAWPEDKLIDALMVGCFGYCETQAAPVLLPKAVDCVLKGDVWVPRQLVPKVIGLLAKLNPALSQAGKTAPPHAAKRKKLDLLTHREIDVVKMLGEGLSNKSIASMLNISERTVKAHLTSIFQKLEVQDRLQLALYLKDIN